MAQTTVECQNCGAAVDIPRHVSQFVCEFCDCQHVLDGRAFVVDVNAAESLLHATTSKLNRVREVRLIREIRELDTSWAQRWPHVWDVAHDNESETPQATKRSAVNRLLNRPQQPESAIGDLLQTPISGTRKRKPPDGKVRVPSTLDAVFCVVGFLIVGLLFLGVGVFTLLGGRIPGRMSSGAPFFFTLFGIMILLMVPYSIRYVGMAREYSRLHDDYVQRRQALVATLKEVRRLDAEQVT